MGDIRIATWDAIGTNVEKCRSMTQVLEASGLNYDVIKEPVFMQNGLAIPNRFVTVRESDGHAYDVISDKFEIVQNRDAFDFVNYMSEDIEFVKAGETANGMVYIIAKMEQVSILGDKFTPFVIFRNGFNAKVKITAAICPLRIVCQNQFNFAFRDTQNAVTVRHVQNATAKLEEARQVLRMSADYMMQMNLIAERYAGMHLSERELDATIKWLFPTDGIENMNAFKRHQLEQSIASFKAAYEHEDNRNFRGTAWGLINAYTDFITHKVPQGKSETKAEGKFITTTFQPSGMNRILTAIDAIAA